MGGKSLISLRFSFSQCKIICVASDVLLTVHVSWWNSGTGVSSLSERMVIENPPLVICEASININLSDLCKMNHAVLCFYLGITNFIYLSMYVCIVK